MSILESATLNPGSNLAVPPPSTVARVLIIDDEEIVCNALGALLSADGFEAVTVQNGQEAVELLRRRRFEVAIADLVMPGMDGIQTIAALKEVDPDVEVIILSGHAGVKSTIAALRQGACDFLQKPTGMTELRPALMRALKRHRSEVAHSEAHARALIDTAREAIVLFNREGVIRDFNPVAEQIFGLARERAVGRNLAEFAIPPELLGVFKNHLELAYREGKDPPQGSIEVPALRQNGEEFPFEISTVVIETSDGKFLSTFGRDVTECKQAEKARRESEAKLQVVFDGVEADIFLIDPATHQIVDANPPALTLVGAERDAVIGAVCHRFVCPAECGRCPVTDLGQAVDNSERILLTVRGERLPIIKTVRPVVIAGQSLLLESFVDISARKRAELALSEAEAHFRSLFTSIPLPTFFYDAETLQYLEVNDAAVSYSGYSRDELLQMRVTDLVAPGFAARVVSHLQALASQSRWHDHGRHRLKDGRLVDVEMDVHAIGFRGRQAALAVIQDVTARRQAEAEMAERHRLAILVAKIGVVLTRAETLRQGLQGCAEILVSGMGVAFARVWTVNNETKVLELQASAGMYTHIDGRHARVPIGEFKIGRIAETGEPHLTNSVQEDSWVGDPEWARRENMVAFAGYPLKVEERVLGVVAAFAREPLTDTSLQTLASVADNIAQFIKRKRAEDALHESEDRYRDLVENSALLIGTHDAQGSILNANCAAARLLETPNAEELVGRSITDFVPADLVPQFDKYLETILHDSHAEGLMVMAAANGERKIIEYRNTLRRKPSNVPTIRWTGQDVTERVQAEEALRVSENRYRLLFERNLAGVLRTTLEGRILDCNQSMARMLGYDSPQDLAGADVRRIWRDPSSRQRMIAKLNENTSLSNYEVCYQRKDGQPTWALINVNKTWPEGRDDPALECTVFDITDRKVAEEKLLLTQFSIEHASDAITWLDSEGRITYVNKASCDSLGRSREELLTLTIADMNPDFPPGAWEKEWQRIKAAGSTTFEARHITKLGRIFPVEVTANYQEFGGREYLFTFARDITERKRAEQSLWESEDQLNAILNNSSTTIFLKDTAGRYIRVNRAFEALCGLSPGQATGKTDHELFPKEVADKFHLNDQRVLHERTSLEFEETDYHGGRAQIYLSIKFQLFDAEGEPYAVAGVSTDITERKQAEEHMRLQTAALESAANGIAIADREGRLVWVNPAFARLTGYSPPEILGRTMRMLKSGQQGEEFYQKLWQTILSGEVWQGEIVNRRKDGTHYIDDTTITPVHDSSGALTHFVAIKQDATGRRRAEQALEERSVYLNTLYEISPLGIVVLDIDGRIKMSNSAFERLFRYSRQEILNATLDDFIVPAELASEAKSLTAMCLSGAGAQAISSRRRSDGSRVEVEIFGVPLVIDGELRGFLALYQDITERKRAEAELVRYAEDLEVSKAAQEEHTKELARLVEELAQERDLLGTVMDNLPDYIFYKDCESRFVRTNPAHAKALGLSDPRQAVGKTDFDFFSQEEAEAYFRDEQQVIARGQPLIGKVEKVSQPDGQLQWRLTTKVPVRDTQGRVTGLVGIARDITERMQAEEILRASEERYRELFENASDMLYTTGLDTRLTSLNRVGQQVLGYSAQEAMQLDLRELVAPKHHEVIRRSRERLLAGDTDITMEVEVATKDGRPMTLELKPRLIFRGGKPVGVQGIARDITGRDAAELELRHTQKLESVGRLASGIAHEINTPIQFVGDNTRFLQDSFGGLQTLLAKYQELRNAAESGSLNPNLLDEVRRAEEASDCSYVLEEIPNALSQTLDGVTRVATIVRAMKEFAHPESKEMAAADLNRALLSTVTVARNELKYVADVETEFGDLPLVVCNVGDLNQVFLNLLVNAAHAINENVKGTGERGKIRVCTSAEGSNILVSIADTGCGIPDANRTRVFDPFFTTKEVGRGTGQGLAIARSVVVDRHKGSLTFESEVGKGTTFYIRLPVDPGGCSKEARGA